MPKKGKCTNIFCKEDGKVVSLDANHTCPACGHPQTEISGGISFGKTLLIAVVAIAAVVALWNRFAPKFTEEKKETTIIAEEKPVRRKPTGPKTTLLPAGTRVPGSTKCQDCEAFYWVADGKGGKVRKSEGYTTECCKCGSRVAFSDGYYYDIVCEGSRISAKMGDPVTP
jgi:Zn finger protein HypA/HybF involved in hydrogenase expression